MTDAGAPPPPPPPGAPPPDPPPPGWYPVPAAAPPPKRKRWPWIVVAIVLFCGLPLGGCIALVGFGINEINKTTDEIEDTAADFFTATFDDDDQALSSLTDGGAGCASAADLRTALQSLSSSDAWREAELVDLDVEFVSRGDNSFLSNASEPESLVVAGRGSESTAIVGATARFGDAPEADLVFTLLRPDGRWRVCGMRIA